MDELFTYVDKGTFENKDHVDFGGSKYRFYKFKSEPAIYDNFEKRFGINVVRGATINMQILSKNKNHYHDIGSVSELFDDKNRRYLLANGPKSKPIEINYSMSAEKVFILELEDKDQDDERMRKEHEEKYGKSTLELILEKLTGVAHAESSDSSTESNSDNNENSSSSSNNESSSDNNESPKGISSESNPSNTSNQNAESKNNKKEDKDKKPFWETYKRVGERGGWDGSEEQLKAIVDESKIGLPQIEDFTKNQILDPAIYDQSLTADNPDDVTFYTEDPPEKDGFDSSKTILMMTVNKEAFYYSGSPSANGLDDPIFNGAVDGDTIKFDFNKSGVKDPQIIEYVDLSRKKMISFFSDKFKTSEDRIESMFDDINENSMGIRFLFFDAPEVLHIKYEAAEEFRQMTFKEAQTYKAIICKYTCKDPGTFEKWEPLDADQKYWFAYKNRRYYQVCDWYEDYAHKNGKRPNTGYTKGSSAYLIKQNDTDLLSIADGYLGSRLVSSMFQKATAAKLVVDLNFSEKQDKLSGYPRRADYSSFDNELVRNFFNGLYAGIEGKQETIFEEAGVNAYGMEHYRRLLSIIYLKVDGKWINLNKYVISKLKYAMLLKYSGSANPSLRAYSYEHDTKVWADRVWKSIEKFDTRHEVQRKAFGRDDISESLKSIRDWTLTLGDVTLFVPPISIRTVTQSNYPKSSILRSKGSAVFNSYAEDKMLQIECFFNEDRGINGAPVAIKTNKSNKAKEVTYHINGVRSLLSQFQFAPYIPIENKYVNEVLGMDAVIFDSFSIETVPNYPRLLHVTLLLREFNHHAFMPQVPNARLLSDLEVDYRNFFAKTINYDLFRWYYQQPLLLGNKLKEQNLPVYSKEFMKQTLFANKSAYFPVDTLDPTISIFAPNESKINLLEKSRSRYNKQNKKNPVLYTPSDADKELFKISDSLWRDILSYQYEKALSISNYNEFAYAFTSFLDKKGYLTFNDGIQYNDYPYTSDTAERKAFGPIDDNGNRIPFLQIRIRLDTENSVDVYDLLRQQFAANFVAAKSPAESGGRGESTGATSPNWFVKYDSIFPNNEITLQFKFNDSSVLYAGNYGYQFLEYCASQYVDEKNKDQNYQGLSGNEELAKNVYDSQFETLDSLTYEGYLNNVLVQGFTANFTNSFAEISLNSMSGGVAPQYMGGQNANLTFSIMTYDKETVDKLDKIPRIVKYLRQRYPNALPLYPFRIDSEFTKLLGIFEVIVTSVRTSTVPNYPGLIKVDVVMESVDRTIRNREVIKKFYEGTLDKTIDAPENASDVLPLSYFDLEDNLSKAELYPDLQLPTIHELGELGFEFIRYKNPGGQVYVDPDFYFIYQYPLFSDLLRKLIVLDSKKIFEDENGSIKNEADPFFDFSFLSENQINTISSGGFPILSESTNYPNRDEFKEIKEAERVLKEVIIPNQKKEQALMAAYNGYSHWNISKKIKASFQEPYYTWLYHSNKEKSIGTDTELVTIIDEYKKAALDAVTYLQENPINKNSDIEDILHMITSIVNRDVSAEAKKANEYVSGQLDKIDSGKATIDQESDSPEGYGSNSSVTLNTPDDPDGSKQKAKIEENQKKSKETRKKKVEEENKIDEEKAKIKGPHTTASTIGDKEKKKEKIDERVSDKDDPDASVDLDYDQSKQDNGIWRDGMLNTGEGYAPANLDEDNQFVRRLLNAVILSNVNDEYSSNKKDDFKKKFPTDQIKIDEEIEKVKKELKDKYTQNEIAYREKNNLALEEYDGVEGKFLPKDIDTQLEQEAYQHAYAKVYKKWKPTSYGDTGVTYYGYDYDSIMAVDQNNKFKIKTMGALSIPVFTEEALRKNRILNRYPDNVYDTRYKNYNEGIGISRQEFMNYRLSFIDPYYSKAPIWQTTQYMRNCVNHINYSKVAFLRNVLYILAILVLEDIMPTYLIDILGSGTLSEAKALEVMKKLKLANNAERKNYDTLKNFVLKNKIHYSNGKIFTAFLLAMNIEDDSLWSLVFRKDAVGLNAYTQKVLSKLSGKTASLTDAEKRVRKFLLAMIPTGIAVDLEELGAEDSESNVVTDMISALQQKFVLSANKQPFRKIRDMFLDMVQTDIRGRMLRGFPTFHLIFIDEGLQTGFWKMHDSFYSSNSISSIQVVKSKNIAADTATIVLNNLYNNIIDEYESFDPTDGFFTQVQYGIAAMEKMYDSIFNPEQYVRDAEYKRSLIPEHSGIKLVSGARIHLRMGYGSDSAKLNPMFNGTITEVVGGEVVQITAQGDGIELSNPILEDNYGDKIKNRGLSYFTWNTSNYGKSYGGVTPRTLISSFLTLTDNSYGSKLLKDVHNSTTSASLRKGTNALRSAMNSVNPFGIYHFGQVNYNRFFINGEPVQNIYEVDDSNVYFGNQDLSGKYYRGFIKDETGMQLNKSVLQGGLTYDGEVLGNVGAAFSNIGDIFPFYFGDAGDFKAPYVSIKTQGRTLWDILKFSASASPSFIGAIGNFGFRSTVFLGRPDWYYAYKYGKTSNSGIIELRKPFQQIHLYTSQNDIIRNEIQTTSNKIATVARGVYEYESMKRSTDDVYFDRDIYPEYQRKIVVDTWLYGRSQTSTTAENLFNVDDSEGVVDNVLGGGVIIGDILGWAWRNTFGRIGDYDFLSGGENHNFKKTARKMAISRLRQSLEQLYSGNIVIYGDPSVKPHDFIFINDEITNLNGPATARDIVHTLSFETGFVTTIAPDAIVDPINDAERKISVATITGTAFGYLQHIQFLKNALELEFVQNISQYVSEFTAEKMANFREKYADKLYNKFSRRYRKLKRIESDLVRREKKIDLLNEKIKTKEEEIARIKNQDLAYDRLTKDADLSKNAKSLYDKKEKVQELQLQRDKYIEQGVAVTDSKITDIDTKLKSLDDEIKTLEGLINTKDKRAAYNAYYRMRKEEADIEMLQKKVEKIQTLVDKAAKKHKFLPTDFLSNKIKALLGQIAIWKKNSRAFEVAKFGFLKTFITGIDPKYIAEYDELKKFTGSFKTWDDLILNTTVKTDLLNYLNGNSIAPELKKEFDEAEKELKNLTNRIENIEKKIVNSHNELKEIDAALSSYDSTGKFTKITPTNQDVLKGAYASDLEKIDLSIKEITNIPEATRTPSQKDALKRLEDARDSLEKDYKATFGAKSDIKDAAKYRNHAISNKSEAQIKLIREEEEILRLQISQHEKAISSMSPKAFEIQKNEKIAKLLTERYSKVVETIAEYRAKIQDLTEFKNLKIAKAIDQLPAGLKERVLEALKSKLEDLEKISKKILELATDETKVVDALKQAKATEASIAKLNKELEGIGSVKVVLEKYNLLEKMSPFISNIAKIFKVVSLPFKVIGKVITFFERLPIVGALVRKVFGTTVAVVTFLGEMWGIELAAFLNNYKTLQITPLTKNGTAFMPFMGGSMGTIVGTPNFNRKGPLFEFITPFFSSDKNIQAAHPFASAIGGILEFVMANNFTEAVDNVNQNIGNQYPQSEYKTNTAGNLLNSFFVRQPLKTYHQLLGPKYPGQSNDNRPDEEKKPDMEALKIKIKNWQHQWNPNGYSENKLNPLVYMPDSDLYQYKEEKFFVSRFEKLDDEDLSKVVSLNLLLGTRTQQVNCIKVDSLEPVEYDAPLIHPYANAVLVDILNKCYQQLSYKDKLDKNEFLNKVSEDYITYASGYKFNGNNIYTSSGFGFTLIPHGESVKNMEVVLNLIKNESRIDYKKDDNKFIINVLIPRDI